MRWKLNGEELPDVGDGPRGFGEDVVLLDSDDDLTAGRPWAAVGYTIQPFLTTNLRAALRRDAAAYLELQLRTLGYCGATVDWTRYHHIAADNPELHAAFVEGVRGGFEAAAGPIPCAEIEAAVGEVCGTRVTSFSPHMKGAYGAFRIVRPSSNDNNPPHRDVWLARLRDAINIYVPLFGSNHLSSLPLVPGSHRWRESEIERTVGGATAKALVYTVPAVTGARRPLELVRPAVSEDQFLVFSPYLIHGGARNMNADTTRVSLEMRFWRAGGATPARD